MPSPIFSPYANCGFPDTPDDTATADETANTDTEENPDTVIVPDTTPKKASGSSGCSLTVI